MAQSQSLGVGDGDGTRNGWGPVGPLCPKTICRHLAETELSFSFSFWPFCKFMSHRVDNLKNGLPTTTSAPTTDPEIYALLDFNKKAYR